MHIFFGLYVDYRNDFIFYGLFQSRSYGIFLEQTVKQLKKHTMTSISFPFCNLDPYFNKLCDRGSRLYTVLITYRTSNILRLRSYYTYVQYHNWNVLHLEPFLVFFVGQAFHKNELRISPKSNIISIFISCSSSVLTVFWPLFPFASRM